MDREEILRIWEETWQPLTAQQVVSFLNRDATRRLTAYPDRDVELAIKNNRKLDLALKEAEVRLWVREENRKASAPKLQKPPQEVAAPKPSAVKKPPRRASAKKTSGTVGVSDKSRKRVPDREPIRRGVMPRRAVDEDLLKKIGPVQKYDDTF